VLYGQAFLESIRYNDAKAWTLYEQSLALYTDLGDQLGIAQALNGLGFVTRRQPDWKAAARFFEKALKIGYEIKNKHVIAASLEGIGLTAFRQGHWQEARNFFEKYLAIERELKNTAQIANALLRLGSVDIYQGDTVDAQARYEESLSLYRELNFKEFSATLLNQLGELARYQGDYEKASALYRESLSLYQEQGVGFENNQMAVQINMGYVMFHQGQHSQAYELFQKCFLLGQKLGDSESSALCLTGLAGILASQNRPQKAVSLISAGRANFDATDDILPAADQVEYEYILAKARAQLNAMAFEAAWAKGYAMSLEQAIAYALEDDTGPQENISG
jgi:tetratricopeptide (TPR) repeat protein